MMNKVCSCESVWLFQSQNHFGKAVILQETMGYTVGSNSSMNDFQSSAITVDCWGMIFTTVQVTSSRRKGEKKWSTNMANGSKQ
ncbi:hypothetical protein CFP56_015527 [Quercus suber]|uniref:Uncharacterized protein n=1 Tax=Quercus suber TaxID=58331 RepID=A0AAW0KSG9_QUESU